MGEGNVFTGMCHSVNNWWGWGIWSGGCLVKEVGVWLFGASPIRKSSPIF